MLSAAWAPLLRVRYPHESPGTAGSLSTGPSRLTVGMPPGHQVWTMIANPSATETASVTIRLAGTVLGTYTLAPGAIAAPKFSDLVGGPVEVEADKAIISTQRVLTNSGSFNEYAGVSVSGTGQDMKSYLLWTK